MAEEDFLVRVTFLTPRLAPAVCGIADHTRLLAAAMARQGARAGFIHCEPAGSAATGLDGPADHWTGGSEMLRRLLERQAPDWLWVQLSGYGYSRWGAPYRLGRAMAALLRGAARPRLAVCVHETHCSATSLGLKGPLLSRWQRHTVGRVARLGDLVFPTNAFYAAQVVQSYGASPTRVHLLPIGSNLPAVSLTEPERAALRRGLGWGSDEVVAVTFGSFESQQLSLARFAELLLSGIRARRLDRVACLGGERGGVPIRFAGWARRLTDARLDVLGHRPAEECAAILAAADFAFLHTPRSLVEKSGAFMACAAAGLAVLVRRGPAGCDMADGSLPVLDADAWDWAAACSPAVAALRRALREHARAHYDWDAIACRAMGCMRAAPGAARGDGLRAA